MARRKTKVRPEESLLGNMDGQDREWLAMNHSTRNIPAGNQSVNSPVTSLSPFPNNRVLAGDTKDVERCKESTVSLQAVSKPNIPPLSPNLGMRRQVNNIACCEKTLQENDPETWARKTDLGSYAILHSEPNLNQVDSSSEDETVENTNVKEPADAVAAEGAVMPSAEDVIRTREKDRARKISVVPREVQRRALLHYFAKITSSSQIDVALDLEHMQSLLKEGALVNESDDFGQTVLHEVSRVWGIDVAQFLVKEG